MRIKSIILSSIFTFFFHNLIGQGISPIEISSNYKSDRELYEITVRNNTGIPKVVVVDFTSFSGLNASMPLPAILEIPARGITKKLTLRKSGVGTPRFSYKYTYYDGCVSPSEDSSVNYALPFYDDYETIPYPLNSIENYIKKNGNPPNWNAIAFLMDEGDTIHASRKGIVEKVIGNEEDRDESLEYSSKNNYVIVRHNDCTLARYLGFGRNAILVKPGDYVNVGDPLGIVNKVPLNGKIQVRLSFYYYDIKSVIESKAKNEAIYFPVNFITQKGIISEWDFNDTYKARIDESVIMQEMTKREVKKWRKANSGQ